MKVKVTGKITPIGDKILVSDMEFGNERTVRGIIIPSDNGKVSGIHPRWGKVWAVGAGQTEVKVGNWVLMEHGRWSRNSEYEDEDGNVIEIRLVDNAGIMMVADEKPSDVVRSQ
jgi:co-chaperonin GroES (HSP10)